MQFCDSFFEDEVRDGFYVPALIKRSWAAQLEVLEEIDRICKKYHIRWFADGGTLLGAVRHGGFIPWDDDLDICMLRKDYILFNAVAKKELAEGYFIPQSREIEYRFFTSVWNTASIPINKTRLEKFHGFPYPAGVDIFVLDHVAPNPDDEVVQRSLAGIVANAAVCVNEDNKHTAESEELISEVEGLLHVHFHREQPIQEQLFVILENLFSLYMHEDTSDLASMCYWIIDHSLQFPAACYANQLMLPFEGIEIPVPVLYRNVLRIFYGDRYEIPCHAGGEHEYPCYKRYEGPMEQLERKGKNCFFPEYPKDHLTPENTRNSMRRMFHDSVHLTDETKETLSESSQKEVVFLPYKASMWKSLEPAWKAACADPEWDVHVIPIPYYYRNLDGNLRDMQYQGEQFPAYVPIEDHNCYDLETRHPDVIFIHNPYDDCNLTTSVHPFFYSKNLLQYTEKLVYVPYFVMDEIEPDDPKAIYNMKYYVSMPGVIHADKVLVQSEKMRLAYIDHLTEFAGEDTRPIWEKKITVFNEPIV